MRSSSTAVVVTTSGQPDAECEARARAAAGDWKVPFLPRRPLEEMFDSAEAVIVFGRNGVTLWDRLGKLRWSPGMAALRVAHAKDDTLIRLGEFRAGDAVLDCTLGLGQDALVAREAVGPEGRVVGIEKSLPLFAVVSSGLRGIEAIHADAATWLPGAKDRSFDVVMFEPMFERTRPASGDFEVLRRFADYSPLTPEMIEHARRVARGWVLVKASRYSKDLSKLGLTAEPCSRFATVQWARLPPG